MHEVADEHLMQNILSQNDDLALHNRQHFDDQHTFAINVMSAPGAGKTTLLTVTVPKLNQFRCEVVEGDMVGELDAERLRSAGIRAHQISTGRSCHLDARMVSRFLHEQPIECDYLFIENVGNLVCPAEFPLGEHARVVVLSVTEGDDKPLKYPVIFRQCDAVIFSKCDLLPYVHFDIPQAEEYLKTLNPSIKTFALSSTNLNGFDQWISWLIEKAAGVLPGKNSIPPSSDRLMTRHNDLR